MPVSFLFTMSEQRLGWISASSTAMAEERSFPTKTDFPNGGAGRDRTDDILLAKQVLSQLSYSPVFSRQGSVTGIRKNLITAP